MPTIAIVGAGPGMGLSIAKVFGGHGFDVALISRGKDNLDALVAQLAESGITAEGFPADVADLSALTAALAQATERFGAIDVLEYSPHSGLTMVNPPEVTVDNLQPAIQHLLYGAVTATQAVLPAMLTAGAGTLLYTMGGGAIDPYPMLATVNTAQAGLRNWVHNLHKTLADKGIHAAVVAINLLPSATAPEGVPHADPDDIAQIYWDLHTRRDRPEHLVAA
ncbi:NAD(P)-dependent dehydrogenase (short-subunit alcohol dehydrogenase family) [Kibdelosporangium banguiense]|uniref:NAD(P)-dependent dehydrogenase (Short-subunit alcohol dehydrogenase family) n=1 Tax=Kibdelosporangium banguiense TaxID=1365924 RepID=A0ABS4TKQ6_9PSEU|nr:SDR family NAD(P)-dependent oxidoreductase [Kibdelosporangium banguiense]MBP2324461.1 NAD(P)-dependent dehydrogenase (short-subunit alcohol dehydrogenase family) [Kibdelosporangium banguiense]